MKMFKIASILIFALLFVQPIFAQNSGRKVVAIHIDNKDNMSNQQDLLRDVNAYLHKVFEQNGYALASVELEDRVWANMLEEQNFIDANVRGKNGEPIDYIFSISLEYYANDYKFYSKRIGTINTDYRQSVPIVKNRKIIDEQDIRYLIALEIVDNYDKLSATNQTLLVKLHDKEQEMIDSWRRIDRRYEVLSFLPPVNQLRSHTSKGRRNGIAILTGYSISVGTFIGSTISYNANKRKLDNVSIGLAEANKAKELYNRNMDICRGCQIASAALFVGSYIYGVANAFANKSDYQNNLNVTIAPITYDSGGAGLAFVIKF